MITIYKNQEECEKAEMMDIWKADLIAVANGDNYDIKKSRYTCRVSGVSYYYLADLIRKILNYAEPDIEGNRFTYPFIGNHKGSKDLVVLFTDKRIGYVLRKNQYNKVLHFKNNWNMACFEPFNGTLAIE